MVVVVVVAVASESKHFVRAAHVGQRGSGAIYLRINKERERWKEGRAVGIDCMKASGAGLPKKTRLPSD